MNPPQARHELTQRLPSTLNRTRDAIPTALDDRRLLDHYPEPKEAFRVHRPAPPRADDAEVRAEAARRQRHTARLDRWSEIRTAASACLAVVATVAILVVGVLVVGAMLGEWTVPLR